ncbi:MAG: hypothetical protein WAM66_12785 [Acidobacteriaceae bacterium]
MAAAASNGCGLLSITPTLQLQTKKDLSNGMIDSRLNKSDSTSETNESKLAPALALEIRRLSHDLSNALEVIMQTNYLLGMTKDSSTEDVEKWREMLDRGVAQATQVNRELRDYIRANS